MLVSIKSKVSVKGRVAFGSSTDLPPTPSPTPDLGTVDDETGI